MDLGKKANVMISGGDASKRHLFHFNSLKLSMFFTFTIGASFERICSYLGYKAIGGKKRVAASHNSDINKRERAVKPFIR